MVLDTLRALHSPESANSLMVIVGGSFDRSRLDDARTGVRPRNDLTEFSDRLGGEIVDFEWLADPARSGRSAKVLMALCKRTSRWSEVLAIRAFFASRRHAAVYLTGEDLGIPFAVLTRLAWWRKQRIVMRIENYSHGGSPRQQRTWSALFRFALGRIDTVVCRSEHHAAVIRGIIGRDPRRVIALGQEVDCTYYDPGSTPAGTAADVVPSEPYLLSAGLEMRDYRTLFAAVETMPIHLIVGAASPWSKDGFQVDSLPPNVTVGRYSLPEMRELYRHATVVVLATRSTDRSCGISVIGEAWSMARPVVAATDGLRDAVVDAGSVAIEPGDTEGLRDAIQLLLESGDRRAEIGQLGCEYARRELHLDRFVDRIAELIR